MKHYTLVRSQQNGVFHFVKANRLYENGFIPPVNVNAGEISLKWDNFSPCKQFLPNAIHLIKFSSMNVYYYFEIEKQRKKYKHLKNRDMQANWMKSISLSRGYFSDVNVG